MTSLYRVRSRTVEAMTHPFNMRGIIGFRGTPFVPMSDFRKAPPGARRLLASILYNLALDLQSSGCQADKPTWRVAATIYSLGRKGIVQIVRDGSCARLERAPDLQPVWRH